MRSKQPSGFRKGTLKNAAGIESDHARCPKCKKLRQRWFRANAHHPNRKPWERIEEGKSKVCHICVARSRGELPAVTHGMPAQAKPIRSQAPRTP